MITWNIDDIFVGEILISLCAKNLQAVTHIIPDSKVNEIDNRIEILKILIPSSRQSKRVTHHPNPPLPSHLLSFTWFCWYNLSRLKTIVCCQRGIASITYKKLQFTIYDDFTIYTTKQHSKPFAYKPITILHINSFFLLTKFSIFLHFYSQPSSSLFFWQL